MLPQSSQKQQQHQKLCQSSWRSYNFEVRYMITLMLCLANALNYICRMNMSIAIPNFISDQHERGIVLSGFFYGYITTQIMVGYMSSKIGVKRVLAIGVIIWTVCDFATVLVYKSIPLLVVIRAGMGCGEGVIMSSLHIFASNWYPISEQATLLAITASGSELGSILALLISPFIIQRTGVWQCIFIVFDLITFVWLLFYLRNVTSQPEQHPYITQCEKDMIISTRKQQQQSSSTKSQNIPWRILFTNRYLWVIYVMHFCATYVWYILLGWLPTYVHEKLNFDLKEEGNQIYAAFPCICSYIGLLMAGKLSDYLISKAKFRTLKVRRFMNCIGSFGPAILLYVLPYVKTPIIAIYVLAGTLFFARCCTSGFFINMIDIGSDHVGTIMGLSNSIATIPGICGNLITGYILKKSNDNWTIVFHLAAFISAFGGIVFAFGSTDRDIFSKRPKSLDEEEEDERVDAGDGAKGELNDKEETEPFLP